MWDGRRFGQTKAEIDRGYDSLLDTRNTAIHTPRRKPWSKSFMTEPLGDYERLLLPRVAQLNQLVKKSVVSSQDGVGKLDIAEAIAFFSFDFMGDIAYVRHQSTTGSC